MLDIFEYAVGMCHLRTSSRYFQQMNTCLLWPTNYSRVWHFLYCSMAWHGMKFYGLSVLVFIALVGGSHRGGFYIHLSVCLVRFCARYLKPMQLGSLNLTYKYSTMSPRNPFILGSKSQSESESQKHCRRGSLRSRECFFFWILESHCNGTNVHSMRSRLVDKARGCFFLVRVCTSSFVQCIDNVGRVKRTPFAV